MNNSGAAALLVIASGLLLFATGHEEAATLGVYGGLFLLFLYLGVRKSRWWLLPAGLQLAYALGMLWVLSQGH